MAASFNTPFILIGCLRAPCKRLHNPRPVASGSQSRLSLQNSLALSWLLFESCHFSFRLDAVDFPNFLTDTDRSGVFVAKDRNPIETDLNNSMIEKSGHGRIHGLQQCYHISVPMSCFCSPFCWLHSGRLVPSGGKSASSKGGFTPLSCLLFARDVVVFPTTGGICVPPHRCWAWL